MKIHRKQRRKILPAKIAAIFCCIFRVGSLPDSSTQQPPMVFFASTRQPENPRNDFARTKEAAGSFPSLLSAVSGAKSCTCRQLCITFKIMSVILAPEVSAGSTVRAKAANNTAAESL